MIPSCIDDGQKRENDVMQDHPIALQPLLQSLAHRTRLPLQMEAQRELYQMSEQSLGERAEHAPLDARVDKPANLVGRPCEKLREHKRAQEQDRRDKRPCALAP